MKIFFHLDFNLHIYVGFLQTGTQIFKIDLPWVSIDVWMSTFKAFPSKVLKNLAFSISKTNFITFNTSLYNTTYIKISIFLPLHLNILSLLFFIHFFSFLSLSLSFSTQLFSAPPATTLSIVTIRPTTHTTTTTNLPPMPQLTKKNHIRKKPTHPHPPHIHSPP